MWDRKEQDMALETDETEGIIVDFAKSTVPYWWNEMSMDERRAWLANSIFVGIEPRPWICTLEVWCDCFNRRREDLKKSDSIRIGAALAKAGWIRADSKHPCGPYGMQRVFFNPDVQQP